MMFKTASEIADRVLWKCAQPRTTMPYAGQNAPDSMPQSRPGTRQIRAMAPSTARAVATEGKKIKATHAKYDNAKGQFASGAQQLKGLLANPPGSR